MTTLPALTTLLTWIHQPDITRTAAGYLHVLIRTALDAKNCPKAPADVQDGVIKDVVKKNKAEDGYSCITVKNQAVDLSAHMETGNMLIVRQYWLSLQLKLCFYLCRKFFQEETDNYDQIIFYTNHYDTETEE